MDIWGYIEEKTSARSLFGPNSLFQQGVRGFYSGMQSGIMDSVNPMPRSSSNSVIQGIPNWALGLGIVYLAMRK
tara:strand:+ start:2481 stop:2702 length:222 start_codon:yes stop_codon:yes gene_type:complete